MLKFLSFDACQCDMYVPISPSEFLVNVREAVLRVLLVFTPLQSLLPRLVELIPVSYHAFSNTLYSNIADVLFPSALQPAVSRLWGAIMSIWCVNLIWFLSQVQFLYYTWVFACPLLHHWYMTSHTLRCDFWHKYFLRIHDSLLSWRFWLTNA